MVGNGGFYPVKALLVLVRVVQLAVTGGKDHIIVPEHRVRLQLFRQRSGTVHPVQQPEGVLQLGTQLRVENGNLFWVVMASRSGPPQLRAQSCLWASP